MTIDVWTVYGGSLLLLIGYAAGWIHTRARLRRMLVKVIEADPPKICQCTHGLSFHDKDGCHAVETITEKVVIGEITKSDTYEGRVTKPVTFDKIVDTRECTCRAYVGPDSEYDVDLRLAELQRGTTVDGAGNTIEPRSWSG